MRPQHALPPWWPLTLLLMVLSAAVALALLWGAWVLVALAVTR